MMMKRLAPTTTTMEAAMGAGRSLSTPRCFITSNLSWNGSHIVDQHSSSGGASHFLR
uniref:Uncharacterized protein n=1 Tax=Oryza punctata TaxID=4537 RepID=A0A0E0JKX8_ORYPU